MFRPLSLLIVVSAFCVAVPVSDRAAAQEAKPKKKAAAANGFGPEARAKRTVAAVEAEMELSDEQKSLLMKSLVERFKGSAKKIKIDTPQSERQKVWKETFATFTQSLSDKFSKEEVQSVNKIIKKLNARTRLFNGKDLEGWEQVNGTATYEVIDGAIVGTTVAGSPNSFLATKKRYGNFDLTFEVFLVNSELNSGVQFRSNQHTEESLKEFKKKQPVGRVFGYQCEIEAAAEGDLDPEKYGDAGYIYDEARRGWLVDDETRLSAKTRNAFRNNQWNRMRIVADGDQIRTFINGKKICELNDDMTDSGFIALQVHGIGKRDEKWQVKWRNIQIRELK